MHPVLARRRHLALYFLAWLLISVLLSMVLARDGQWVVALAVFVPTTLAYAVMGLSTWYLCRVLPLSTDAEAWRALPAHLLASVLASGALGTVTAGWARGVDRFSGEATAAALLTDRGPALFIVGILLYGLTTALHYMTMALEASRESERRALELALLAREAELKALRAQIDPHFMFNSLHSIGALTTANPAAARRMCLLLADFLRETLRLGANHRITLADELLLADRFLAIEQVRFGDRLRVAKRADNDASACLVPPLILQPLVENAVVHGVSQLVDGGTIELYASRSDALLTIALENPCDPDRRHSRGVGLGLELLRRRLVTQCGVADPVSAVESAGRYRVEIRIPVATVA